MKFDSLALPLLSLAVSPVAAQGGLRGLPQRQGGGKGGGKGDGKGDGKVTMIVTLKGDKGDKGGIRGAWSKCDALARANGGSVGRVFQRAMNGCTIEIPSGSVAAMTKSSDVMFMEADQEMKALQQPPPYVWGLDRTDQCDSTLGEDGAYEQMDAAGVRVYILDTGIDRTHTSLVDYITEGSDCNRSFIDDEGAFEDGHGHGTHVAGTACGKVYGVAKNCDLCAIKVLSNGGSGSNAGVIAGVEHVMNNCPSGAKCVANMSLGGGFSQALNDAVNNAVAAGVVFPVAAGNENQNACNVSPASAADAITVGATTQTDERSSFSNWGACVNVSAPGSGILSSLPNQNSASWSGTSMASPHVAGLAAGIIGENSSLSVAAVKSKIIHDATETGNFDNLDQQIRVANNRGCNGPVPPPAPPPTVACGPDKTRITVDIQTDNYPGETTWTLRDSCADMEVLEGGPYAVSSTTYSETTTACFRKGHSFQFRIADTFGDGICCDWGFGSYTVKDDNGNQLASGGQFGGSETKTFGSCETSLAPPPVTPVNSAPTSPPTPNPTNPPTPNPTPAPTTDAPTFFACSHYNEAECTSENECQWIGTCHNCGCVPLPREE